MSPRYLRISFQQLLLKRQFDSIMDVLLKERNSDTLHAWLYGDNDGSTNSQQQHRSSTKNKNNHHDSIMQYDLESTGETPLHQIAKVQPPAWIVEALVNCLTDMNKNSPLDVTDILGRTPLHIAVIYGSIEAIPIYANGCTVGSYITAPLIQDKWLRCPLHWACTYPVGGKLCHNNTTTLGTDHRLDDRTASTSTMILSRLVCTSHRRGVATDMFDTVRILLNSYPEATLIRDHDHKTPYEIAIESNADPSIIHMIQQMEYTIRRGRKDSMNVDNYWGRQPNGYKGSKDMETMSMTNTESDSMFMKGFPVNEISIHTHQQRPKHSATNMNNQRFEYICFEC